MGGPEQMTCDKLFINILAKSVFHILSTSTKQRLLKEVITSFRPYHNVAECSAHTVPLAYKVFSVTATRAVADDKSVCPFLYVSFPSIAFRTP